MENKATKLSNLQMELLKLYERNVSEEELLEIKDLLAQYFAKKATEQMDKLWDERGYNNETMEQWANEHMRTPYRPQ